MTSFAWSDLEMTRFTVLPAVIAGPFLIAAGAGPMTHPEPKTKAAVLAADDEWLGAERIGDVGTLNARLADQYQDITPTGEVHSKAQLLAATAARTNRATGTIAEVAAAFRKQNPIVETVLIEGNTAILSFHSPDPALEPIVRSEDVFTYEDGMWKGILSAHSSPASKAH